MPDEHILWFDENNFRFDDLIFSWWILLPKTYHTLPTLLAVTGKNDYFTYTVPSSRAGQKQQKLWDW